MAFNYTYNLYGQLDGFEHVLCLYCLEQDA